MIRSATLLRALLASLLLAVAPGLGLLLLLLTGALTLLGAIFSRKADA